MAKHARFVSNEDGTLEISGSQYNRKYLLENLLVYGYCGDSYRRQIERGKAVWRDATRIEKDKDICSHSPTIDEKWIQDILSEKICTDMLGEVVGFRQEAWLRKLEVNTSRD